MNDWKQEEFGLIQRVGDRWHFFRKGLYIILWNRIESFILLYDFLEISVMCHENPSRPEKYWAGRHDTSMTDLKNMTLLIAKQSQTSRPDMNRVLTLGFTFDGEVSWIREVSCFCHPLFRGIRSLQWLQRRPWWKQKKSTNRRVNHLQKILI